jgi:hypothetical protein
MDSRREADVIEGFEFVDNGRTFTCQVEAPGPARTEAWWWFSVSTPDRASTADRHRYAPFRAAASDTRASVQSAIVAFYDDLLARRALPAPSYWRRGARATATAAK